MKRQKNSKTEKKVLVRCGGCPTFNFQQQNQIKIIDMMRLVGRWSGSVQHYTALYSTIQHYGFRDCGLWTACTCPIPHAPWGKGLFRLFWNGYMVNGRSWCWRFATGMHYSIQLMYVYARMLHLCVIMHFHL